MSENCTGRKQMHKKQTRHAAVPKKQSLMIGMTKINQRNIIRPLQKTQMTILPLWREIRYLHRAFPPGIIKSKRLADKPLSERIRNLEQYRKLYKKISETSDQSGYACGTPVLISFLSASLNHILCLPLF